MIDWRFVYGKNPYLQIVSKSEALDIDDIEDYKMCEALNSYLNNSYVRAKGDM